MTATQRFIEAAIEGGWDDTNYAFYSDAAHRNFKWVVGSWEYDEKVFLDPEAWKAVGKVEGWGEITTLNHDTFVDGEPWRDNMHHMIDALAEGKDIETYLSTII